MSAEGAGDCRPRIHRIEGSRKESEDGGSSIMVVSEDGLIEP